MKADYWLLMIILLSSMLISVKAGKLTLPAAITGGVLGCLVFAGAGFTGITEVAVFFISGTLVTSWKRTEKTKLGIAEANKGRRNAAQVLANAGVAGILGLLIYLLPQHTGLFRLMMAAGIASATADTVSSELGNVYGKRFYNILSFKKDTRGLDGVISMEGTLLGVAGSLLIALVYATGFHTWNVHIVWIIVAGTIGNVADSLLGAALERKGYLQNNAVNFLNTLTASLTALLFYEFFIR